MARWPPVRWGNLRRTTPVSDRWGVERGTPVDRVYIERFLRGRAHLIQGHVLEVQQARYTCLGGTSVTKSDILDVDPTNSRATVVVDLCDGRSLATARYDCIIVTQTLQYLSDLGTALANLWQALRPGGALLVTVPTTSRLDPAVGHDEDLLRFTPAGLEGLLVTHLAGATIEILGLGNVLAAVAFLMGISAEELHPHELDVADPSFPLVACAVARKSPILERDGSDRP